jgi:hypothetical protein
MIHDSDIYRMGEIEDRYQAADCLGLVLYGPGKCPRWAEFRAGFLEGLEDYQTGRWQTAQGVGPRATGNNLAPVWAERRW